MVHLVAPESVDEARVGCDDSRHVEVLVHGTDFDGLVGFIDEISYSLEVRTFPCMGEGELVGVSNLQRMDRLHTGVRTFAVSIGELIDEVPGFGFTDVFFVVFNGSLGDFKVTRVQTVVDRSKVRFDSCQ